MPQNLTDPKTGELVLRNESNWFFGSLVSWALLILAALFFNGSTLYGADSSSGSEILLECLGMFGISMSSRLVLGRPLVAIGSGVARVRNPLREYRVKLEIIQRIDDGFFGFPTVRVEEIKIRLFGLQESVLSDAKGGSNQRLILDAAIREHIDAMPPERQVASSRGDSSAVTMSWQILDRWTALLLVGWAVFGASFFLPLWVK